MTLVELDVRHKELVLLFKSWLRNRGMKQWTCDDLRKFLSGCSQPYKRLLLDQAKPERRLNLGSLINGMLNSHNPNHRIEFVDWTTKDTKYNRRIGIYQYTTP